MDAQSRGVRSGPRRTARICRGSQPAAGGSARTGRRRRRAGYRRGAGDGARDGRGPRVRGCRRREARAAIGHGAPGGAVSPGRGRVGALDPRDRRPSLRRGGLRPGPA
ncbi:MAG: hypothetical protein DYG90_03980 [Chloroflexi bacterium CFX6]|nr:hypothetical protein [Chloroflexi bacterium CFX6]